MYSDGDLEAAVEAGALTPEAAAALRGFTAARAASPIVDEEHFRLVTGFNDIFVSIAAALLLAAVAWLGAQVWPAFGPAATAAASWALAEYFTRARRMALPSILLLGAFVLGVFGAVFAALLLGTAGADAHVTFDDGSAEARLAALKAAVAAACAAGAAWLHWRRFRVPITVAAGAGAGVGLLFALVIAAVPQAQAHVRVLLFVGGIAVFALAMRWDMADPARITRRSDVAFWLHLLAAPLIVHPIFSALGLLDASATGGLAAAIALLLYAGLAAVALAVDRRALMVSALVYVLAAFGELFRTVGDASTSLALTGLLIGSALLLLSAFWHRARRAVVMRLPGELRRRLPILDRDATPTRRPA